jgi:hypothetical protein
MNTEMTNSTQTPACSNPSNGLESLLQPCDKVSRRWKVSCKFAARFPSVGKSPATLRQGFQVLESLMQPCDKVSKRWKVSCIVTAKNSKKRERGIKDFELVV